MEINDLNPAPYNDKIRKMSKKARDGLSKSLERFGDISGITYNKRTKRLVTGHQRVSDLKRLGAKMVDLKIKHPETGEVFPVRVVDWSEKKEKAANIAANNKLIAGEFTEDILGLLPDLDTAEIEGLRFDELEASLGFGGKETTQDEIPEPPKNAITKPGDVWVLGDHRVVCGDSTRASDVQRLLGNNSPFIMVTDPPYGVEYDPEWREGQDLGVGKRSRGKVQNDNQVDWSEAYGLFNGNVAYVWHAGVFVREVAQSIIACGFNIRSHIIWTKQHFAISRGNYHWMHEPCFYAVRKAKSAAWIGGRKQTTVWDIKNNNAFGGGGGA